MVKKKETVEPVEKAKTTNKRVRKPEKERKTKSVKSSSDTEKTKKKNSGVTTKTNKTVSVKSPVNTKKPVETKKPAVKTPEKPVFKKIDPTKVKGERIGRVYNLDDSPIGGIFLDKKRFKFVASDGQSLESEHLLELVDIKMKPLKWVYIKWVETKNFNISKHTTERKPRPQTWVDNDWIKSVRDSLKGVTPKKTKK